MPGTTVLQGDTLAYFVFVKFFGYVMRTATGEDVDKSDFRVKRPKSCRCRQRTISDIEFAYDITSISYKERKRSELLWPDINAKNVFAPSIKTTIRFKLDNTYNFKYLSGYLHL